VSKEALTKGASLHWMNYAPVSVQGRARSA
jgi:hypothetical protein